MPSTPNALANFMGAIRALESGGGNPKGDYSAIGPDIGSKYGIARGAYQIMSGIWDGWAREAGYAGADWRDPRAQDAVASYKMKQYYEQFGSWDLVAIAWFAGPGNARKAQRNGIQSLSGVNDTLTSVPGYVAKIRQYMGKDAASEAYTPPQTPEGEVAYMKAVQRGENPPEPAPPEPRQASPANMVAREVLGQLSRMNQENAGSGIHERTSQAFRSTFNMRENQPEEEPTVPPNVR